VTFDEPTPATVEERYDDDGIPPLPPAPTVIYHTRLPWGRVVAVMIGVAIAVDLVLRGVIR